jgi:hypothetical protein
LNDYAALLSRRGRHHQALPVHARALRLKEAVMSSGAAGNAEDGVTEADAASLGTSLSNLALAHAALPGGCSEALPLLQRALRLRETALGMDHPLVATTRAWVQRCGSSH